MIGRALIAGLMLALLGACDQELQEAVLADSSPETIAILKATLAKAVGRAHVTLGAGDITSSSEVAVLPPPITPAEGNSPAVPIVFDIILQGADCYVRRRGTQELVPLTDVACNPAAP